MTKYEFCEKYLLGNSRLKKEEYDLMSVVMIYLDLDSPQVIDGVTGLLNVLLTSEISALEKTQILQNVYGMDMEETFEREVNDMGGFGEGIAMRYMERGLQQGIEQGIEQAMLASVNLIMKNANCTLDEAFRVLEISDEDKERIRAEIET